jgi:hypothetical protein
MISSRRSVDEQTCEDFGHTQEVDPPRRSLPPFLLGQRRRHVESTDPVPINMSSAQIPEIDRELDEDETLRMAVIIRMPTQATHGTQPTHSNGYSDPESEETGWLPGMEIGVWEGRVCDHQR